MQAELRFAADVLRECGAELILHCGDVGGREEIEGVKAVIDWLNGRAKGFTSVGGDERVRAHWSTGKVGMTGTSYNGTLPNQVATTGVEGLRTIIPVSAISSSSSGTTRFACPSAAFPRAGTCPSSAG